MNPIKIIACLIIITLAGTGYYYYQNKKQKESLIVHNKKKYEQLIEAGHKSSAAGFLVMASAINKFHQTKGHYPKELIHLYPEFIPNKAFILKLNWNYYIDKKKYVLEKNIKGQPIYAMGPDLKIKRKKQEIMHSPEKIVSIEFAKPVIRKISSTPLAIKSEGNQKLDQASITNVPSIKKSIEATKTKPDIIKKVSKDNPSSQASSFIIIRKALTQNEKFLTTFSGNDYYIWKTSQGIIGFSNTQYPDVKNLTIYKEKSWIQYQYK
jgi:hypothetical protein